MIKWSKRLFFGNHISRKHGQKCCPYGQNGKPLSPETVELFLQNFRLTFSDTDDSLEWTTNPPDYTRLVKSFYLQNVFKTVEFITDLYNFDAETTMQIPSVHIIDRDILRIELHTPDLKGLSHRDLDLATHIS